MPMIKIDRLLHTDQISCYDEAGNEVDCLDTGQDGAYGLKTTYPQDRFKLNDAVVEDTWTGLFWHRNANIAEFPLSWEEAFQFVQEMNRKQHSGRSDWRLPRREELFSLVSHQNVNPCLPNRNPTQQRRVGQGVGRCWAGDQ